MKTPLKSEDVKPQKKEDAAGLSSQCNEKQREKAVLKKQAKVGDIVSLKMDPQDVGNNMQIPSLDASRW